MQDPNTTASSIAREVKTLAQGLKESLTKLDPWEREIEFQRSNLRRQLLLLLFTHPYAKESKDADHSLWMATSYFIISSYKSRIAAADNTGHQASEGHPHRGSRNEANGHHPKVGIVEYRKLIHRFRQFLAEESKFWTSFIIRIVRVFDLQSSHPALVPLGITVSSDNLPDASPTRNGRRNLFPNEDATEPPSPTQKEQKLVMLSKALVCLGDIARYREHYNEGGGRPRAGKDFHDDAKSASRGRGRRGAIELLPRPRNYSKAQECYERARLLVPDVGNASHQLAILASYQQDSFGGVFQYYRAICVKQPYETAASNLDSTLSRNLEIYKNTTAKADLTESEQQLPKTRVERFKKAVVALHALWRLNPTDADKQLPGHEDMVIATFSALSSDRILSTDIIWKTVLMAFGASWRHKMQRDSNPERNVQKGLANELRIFNHIVHLLHALFKIGLVQLSDAVNFPEPAINGTGHSKEGQPDLAQNITAVFRRTLPALRIGTKWFCAHLDYVSEVVAKFGREPETDIEGLMSKFWNTCDEFSKSLGKIFPLGRLPKMEITLEEDIEISGFEPLRKVMSDVTAGVDHETALTQSQMHPNEEQLMRIGDLLLDMKSLTRSRADLLPLNGNPPIPGNDSLVSEVIHEENYIDSSDQQDLSLDIDDDKTTASTRTDEDPVDLVMKVVLSHDEDEDEEQVLYPKQNVNVNPVPLSSLPTVASPVISPPVNPPVNPQPNLIQQPSSVTSPVPVQKPVPVSKPVTAEDLVNEMMRPRVVTDSAALSSRTLGPGSPISDASRLLFGSGSPITTSIWGAPPLESAPPAVSGVRRVGYPGARVSPPNSMSGYPSASNLQGLKAVSAGSPRSSSLTHQRQLSQPLYGAIGSPVPRAQGSWTSTQDSSQLSMLSQFMSSQQRQPMSPVGSPSLSSVNNSFNYASLNSQVPGYSSSLMHNIRGLSELPSHPLSPFPQSMNDSTWSFSGLESLSGIGSSLMPFNHGQSHPPPMHRSGEWT